MRHYYKIPLSSATGKKLRQFHHSAIKAADAAEKYAARWGALSYIGTFEAFEGGVEYLEFAKAPDPMIWRKAGHEWDADAREFIYQYEPRVLERTGTQVLPKGTTPSNSWNRIYMPGVAKVLKDQNGNDVWQFRFLEWYGDDEQYTTSRAGKRIESKALRRAIRAERERRALPLVSVQDLAAIIGMRPELDVNGKKKRFVEMETPTFFIVYDYYYISTPAECVCPDATPVEQRTYTFMQGTAKRESEKK